MVGTKTFQFSRASPAEATPIPHQLPAPAPHPCLSFPSPFPVVVPHHSWPLQADESDLRASLIEYNLDAVGAAIDAVNEALASGEGDANRSAAP